MNTIEARKEIIGIGSSTSIKPLLEKELNGALINCIIINKIEKHRAVMKKEPIETLIDDMACFLKSSLSSLGIDRYPTDKEDLMQEIRIRIWKAYKNYQGDIQYLNAYTKKIVYSVFINEVNRLKKEARILESGRSNYLSNEYKDSRSDQSAEVFKECLANAMAKLRTEYQEVVRLRLEGFSIGEIASMKSWSYRKTCNLLYRGMKILKQLLREEGYSYEN